MISLLLMISFLLHIILLTAVYHLYQQLQITKQNQEQELEHILANFLQEIKLENERLQNKLVDQPSHKISKENIPENRNKEFMAQQQREEIQLNESINRQVESKDQLETSIEGQILHLYNQGLSTDDIAKKLNRGKTEVALLLKLHKR